VQKHYAALIREKCDLSTSTKRCPKCHDSFVNNTNAVIHLALTHNVISEVEDDREVLEWVRRMLGVRDGFYTRNTVRAARKFRHFRNWSEPLLSFYYIAYICRHFKTMNYVLEFLSLQIGEG
jgi:hypothetical protein